MKKFIISTIVYYILFFCISLAIFIPLPIILHVIPHYFYHVCDELQSTLISGFSAGVILSLIVLLINKYMKYLCKFVKSRHYYLDLHKYEMAIEFYKETIKELKLYKPKSKSDKKYKIHYYKCSFFDIADCYEKLGDKEQSKIFLNKAMRFIPKNERQTYLDKKLKKNIPEKHELSSKKKILIKVAIVAFMSICCVLPNIIDHSVVCDNCPVIIVSTDNSKTLDNVQNTLLETFNKVIIEKDGTINRLFINNPKKYDFEHAVLKVAGSEYFDNTIDFSTISNTKNISNRNYVKRLKRRLEDVILCVDGVTNAEVKKLFQKICLMPKLNHYS